VSTQRTDSTMTMPTTSVGAIRARLFAASLAASLALTAGLSVVAPAPARAAPSEDNEAVGRITLLNRQAIDAYQNLSFDEAQRLLREALALGEERGLSQHAIHARTCVTLGIVMFGGFRKRDEATRLFRQALQIAPEIRLSRALANPQIQQVFDAAVKGLADEPITIAPAPQPATAGAEQPPERLLVHEPVRLAVRGSVISIEISPDPSLVRDTLVLGYRPAGAAMIPGSATAGGQVEYYIEARHTNGKRITSRGSSVDPIVVTLAAQKGVGEGAVAAPVGVIATAVAARPQPDGTEKRWVLALLAGTGLGWTSGVGEVRQVQVTPSGIAWASLGHIAPEIGYLVTPHLMLGVQGRFQLVSGAAEFVPSGGPAPGVCGGDGVCSPAKAAFAGLAKATWLFRAPTTAFRPYVSLSAGGGLIRHVAQAGNKADCGASQNDKCLDTVAGGPFLFGVGLGFSYQLSESLAFVFAIDGLGGAPKLTAETDMNLGVAFRL
jgi:hypothetical protein